jgi:hypothetical protein
MLDYPNRPSPSTAQLPAKRQVALLIYLGSLHLIEAESYRRLGRGIR